MGDDKAATGMTWTEITYEMNRLTGQNYTESKYRKEYASHARLFNDVRESDPLREIERMKIQFRDERREWQKQNYTTARVAQKLDYLEEIISEIGRDLFVGQAPVQIRSDNDMVVLLSDMHIGQTFDNVFGHYDSDIAKERLSRYIAEILSIAELHNAENCYVVVLGDTISGSIHKSIQVTNRENVIQQIKISSQMIASFVADLAPKFNNVYLTGVSGNHSRIDRKDDALHDERLDDLILWITKFLLKGIDNVRVEEPNIDTGIARFDIRGHSYTAAHGDFDKTNAGSIGKLTMMLGYIPEILLLGHLHYAEMTEVSGVQVIRGGSLAGAGDQYTVEQRLTGQPRQTCCIVNNQGIKAVYPITLL